MRYPEIFAAIEGVTSPEGPFPVREQVVSMRELRESPTLSMKMRT